ncbi:hypothetical protein B0O80DRAFT_528660 [Mortierella sp. GBAus27b]|nr:hypothetical protein BGX31_000687 [Mortierella sp. GBA43]KAI8355458.1 hypothetical protein B0O80DRAFT_528660 [Mortierella sp. GBAus27b]
MEGRSSNEENTTLADAPALGADSAGNNTATSVESPLSTRASSEGLYSSYSSWTVPSLDLSRRASAFGVRYGLISPHASMIPGRTSPAPSGMSLADGGHNAGLLQNRARKMSLHLSESITGVLNDSSLVLYRMNEHIHKKVPQLVEEKKALVSIRRNVETANQDLEDARHTISGMQRITELGAIEQLVKSALEAAAAAAAAAK